MDNKQVKLVEINLIDKLVYVLDQKGIVGAELKKVNWIETFLLN